MNFWTNSSLDCGGSGVFSALTVPFTDDGRAQLIAHVGAIATDEAIVDSRVRA